jgi:hypothetical protein
MGPAISSPVASIREAVEQLIRAARALRAKIRKWHR